MQAHGGLFYEVSVCNVHCHAEHATCHGRLSSDQGDTVRPPQNLLQSTFSVQVSPSSQPGSGDETGLCRGHSGPSYVLACFLPQATARPFCLLPLSITHEVSQPLWRGSSPRGLCTHHSALFQAAHRHPRTKAPTGVTPLLLPSPVRR
uniref:Uncharacterized protein n=1 Tax=Myotis myotis TaxID=51298 RepID=A0A7J7VYJ1_MYOMY|nr:hypothetical protein mMyoMyo1_012276 [Myotis myotis]